MLPAKPRETSKWRQKSVALSAQFIKITLPFTLFKKKKKTAFFLLASSDWIVKMKNESQNMEKVHGENNYKLSTGTWASLTVLNWNTYIRAAPKCRRGPQLSHGEGTGNCSQRVACGISLKLFMFVTQTPKWILSMSWLFKLNICGFCLNRCYFATIIQVQ